MVTASISARTEEVQEAGSPGEPIHHGGPGAHGGGMQVARGTDDRRFGRLLRSRETWLDPHEGWAPSNEGKDYFGSFKSVEVRTCQYL